MSKVIYRRLKDYIKNGKDYTTSIFGTLEDSHLSFWYYDENKGEYIEWSCNGVYHGEKDFLLNYRVLGIQPYYKIVHDKIVVKLRITLTKGESL